MPGGASGAGDRCSVSQHARRTVGLAALAVTRIDQQRPGEAGVFGRGSGPFVRGMRTAACLAVTVASVTACSTGDPDPAAPAQAAVDERLFPAPTSSLFTPAPLVVPTDGPSLWTSLEALVPALDPSSRDEPRRLRACDQLRQLGGTMVEGVSEDYDVEGFAELEIVASANNCAEPEQAQSTYASLTWRLEKSPYREGRP